MDFVIALAIIIALLMVSAFFSGGELALMALDQLNVETEARKGSQIAKLQRYLRSRPQRFLSTILIGNNIANVSLATYAAWLANKYLVGQLGLAQELALAISAGVMTVLITIFSELLPKTLAALNTRKFAQAVTYPLYICNILLTPVNVLTEKVVLPMIHLLTGGNTKSEQKIQRDELATAISLARTGGGQHSKDIAMAHGAMGMAQRDLEDVMTPRVDLVAIADNATAGEALQQMLDSGFSRLPAYGKDLDDISGFLLMKDLVRLSLRGAADSNNGWSASPVKPLLRKIAHLPETKGVVETLSEMQRQRVHLVVVVDEHGGTAGIVSMEDILEELVGEIVDESDKDGSMDVLRQGESYLIVSGKARIGQLPELHSFDTKGYEASTVGGLMLEVLGRPAVVGESIEVDGAKITAVKVLQNRIKLLRIDRA